MDDDEIIISRITLNPVFDVLKQVKKNIVWYLFYLEVK